MLLASWLKTPESAFEPVAVHRQDDLALAFQGLFGDFRG